MHPREGWPKDGSRPPLFSRPVSRRSFLARTGGASLAALGGAALLDACAPALAGRTTSPLPRPNNPVTWPVFPDNKPIASGLKPETGATLQVYNWVAYVNQACLNHFAKKYNCKVQLTTFNTMNEALSKLRAGLQFDVVMGVTVDVLGQLIESKQIQPLNHSYIPNISQAWPDFTQPFYDRGWQYTTPYTIYTTGMAWRKDLVHENPYAMRNPWAMPWQGKYKGKVAILDDYRESISLGLMKNGIFNLNTTDRSQIALSRQSLRRPDQAGQRADRQQRLHRGADRGGLDPPRLVRGYGVRAVLHAEGGPGGDVGYWFPPDGRGPVANDTLTDAAGGHQSGAGPPVPRLPAGPAERAGEHQLQRLHAAADGLSPRSGWSRSNCCPRA